MNLGIVKKTALNVLNNMGGYFGKATKSGLSEQQQQWKNINDMNDRTGIVYGKPGMQND